MSLTLMQFEKKKFKLKLKVIQLLWTFYIKVRISVIFYASLIFLSNNTYVLLYNFFDANYDFGGF